MKDRVKVLGTEYLEATPVINKDLTITVKDPGVEINEQLYLERLKGAGFEDKNNYSRTELTFCEIDNIHTARNALRKIYDMLKSPDFRENK